MKIRTCFVSNSSSSSFIVKKKWLSEKQKNFLRGIQGMIALEYPEEADDAMGWNMFERPEEFRFETSMNNFNLIKYMGQHGFPIEEEAD